VARIIDNIPEVYRVLLDQCFSKSAMYLYIRITGKITTLKVSQWFASHERRKVTDPCNDNVEMIIRTRHSGSIVERRKNEVQTTSNSDFQATTSIIGCCMTGYAQPLYILRKLVQKNNCQVYLLHLVVAAFIQTRWICFSANFYLLRLFFHYLLALLLTTSEGKKNNPTPMSLLLFLVSNSNEWQ